ncbi:acyl carrier protein [Streptacidiphilus pinicola]|uniref:Acyl carrier protein n=1 Tax=Streptacidiphilus pinicola TaxID=2219663 RepID=A0A2X0KDJ9_9ACTN|nr:acyl carrier protein [Streptacidiphilus pinicola]RAG87125.1 acyl carrier protein [Streptacidiphilus pinicola]
MTQPLLAGIATADDRIALVRSLWAEVLETADTESVPQDTNFFDAGGDSLLLVALVERIRQATGVPVRTMDVLRAGTVRGQAALLEG